MEEIVYKIIILGEPTAGKTEFVDRYINQKSQSNYLTSIGLDYKLKSISLKDGTKVKLQIWDTAGQERYRTITKAYFEQNHGIILLYDVTNIETFIQVKSWANQIKNLTSSNAKIS